MDIKESDVTPKIKDWLESGLTRSAKEATGLDVPFVSKAFVKELDGETIGALAVQTLWGGLHIKDIYVDPHYRGKGVAQELMQCGFQFGKDQGCTFAFVETLSFQALDFYLSLGFVLEFTRSGYSHNTQFHYLRKDL